MPSKSSKNAASSIAGPIKIGVELPLTGDAGADGIRALDALTDEAKKIETQRGVPSINLVVRDTALGAYRNAHQDEGVDASGLPPHAATIVADFAKDADILGAVGGVAPSIASADSVAAAKAGLPMIVLAPAPDRCAAATGIIPKKRPLGAVSVAGAASLESLAAAQVVEHRGFREIGIMSDGTGPRLTQATCFIDALAALEAVPATRIARPDLTSDFATLKERAMNGTIDALVYFGPAERGTLVCSASGAVVLSLASLEAASHRGYDSSTLPSDCTWIRRVDDAKRAGSAVAQTLIAAFTAAASQQHGAALALTRAQIAKALYGARPCSAGSADRATFAAFPARRWARSAFAVYDRRCTTAKRL